MIKLEKTEVRQEVTKKIKTLTDGEIALKEKSCPLKLDILKLSDCVIFPGTVVPLVIDEPEQIQLIDEALNRDCILGVILSPEQSKKTESYLLPENPEEVQETGTEKISRIGCMVQIHRIVGFEEKFLRILVAGIERFHILENENADQEVFRGVQVEYLPDLSPTESEQEQLRVLATRLQSLFEDYIKLVPALSKDVKLAALTAGEPSVLANRAAFALSLSMEEKYELLETRNVRKRIERLIALAEREIELARLDERILKATDHRLLKLQRDNYLREQLKSIQKELGNDAGQEIRLLREQIYLNGLEGEALDIARRELQRLETISYASPEYATVRSYLDWLVSLPWKRKENIVLDLAHAHAVLDQSHYGLFQVKERLLEYLAGMKASASARTPILCLVGPSGVGKTSLGKRVAEAMGRKFCRISLGGIRDVAELRGHRRTYVSALPGRIIQNLRRLGTRNPVILLDEIDKVGDSSAGAEVEAALMEVLDPAQNNSFIDLYMGIPFDLSEVFFIVTANWLDPLPEALRNRLEVIELPGYTTEEKMGIAMEHILPSLAGEMNLPRNFIRFSQEALFYLIESYTREGGVRELRRQLAILIRRILLRRLESGLGLESENNVSLKTEEDVRRLLGRPRYEVKLMPRKINETGIVISLAWTPHGGETALIEVTRMPGRGNLILTGNLGKVLSESARIALSFLFSEKNRFGIEPGRLEENDIHVHIPSGSVSKDGPSAGLAIAAGLASLFSDRKLKDGLGITGELSLRGRVLPVDGIFEKVLAAIRAGLSEVILPEGNRSDWEEMPEMIKQKISPYFTENAAEAIVYALSAEKSK